MHGSVFEICWWVRILDLSSVAGTEWLNLPCFNAENTVFLLETKAAMAESVTYWTYVAQTQDDTLFSMCFLALVQFRPLIALRTDLLHITTELWEITVLWMVH